MSEARTSRVADFCVPVRRRVPVEEGVKYNLLGVRWYGRGTFVREQVTSVSAKARHYFKVAAGDFVYNRLFAWKASFAVVPPEHDGFYVSGEFPLFEVDSSKAAPAYLLLLMLRQETIERVLAESTGSTSVSRNRWREEFLLDMEFDLPPLEEQARRVGAVGMFDAYVDALNSQLEAAAQARRAIAEALTSTGLDVTGD